MHKHDRSQTQNATFYLMSICIVTQKPSQLVTPFYVNIINDQILTFLNATTENLFAFIFPLMLYCLLSIVCSHKRLLNHRIPLQKCHLCKILWTNKKPIQA